MNAQLKTIRLRGVLGATFGRIHRLAVSSPAEAVRALCVTKPGFEKFLMEAKDNGLGFAVFIGKRNLREDQLLDLNGREEIRIAPMLLGAKRGGVLQIILGVVLIAVGIYMVGAFGWTGIGGKIGGYMIGMGISMIVGGVMQMLAPRPKGKSTGDKPENTPSYAFNGSVNTMAQGYPVPVAYGQGRWGSAVISAGIFAQDNLVAPTPGAIAGGGVGSGGGGGGAGWRSFAQ